MQRKAVYVGLREGSTLPTVAKWILLNDATELTDETVVFKPSHKKKDILGGGKPFIGDIFLIEVGEGSCKPADSNRVGIWPNEEQRREWHAESDMAKAYALGILKSRDEGFKDLTLTDLKEMYSKIIGRERRAAFLATAIQCITG